jgi:hypothetical protein
LATPADAGELDDVDRLRAGGGEEELRISAAVLGVGALLVVLEVYANIFTMRVIGLYYHHFKERFAWSWG